MKAILADRTPYSKIMISVGIILLSAVLFTIISTVIVTSIFSIGTADMQGMVNDIESPRNVAMLKIIQTISALGTFIIPPVILANLFSTDPAQYLSLNRKPAMINIIIVMLAMIAATPLINFLGEINSSMHLPGAFHSVENWMKSMEDQAARLTKAFLKMDTTGSFLVNLVMIGLIPAIGEELVFRGILQKLLTQITQNKHTGILLAAILFSAMHMQFYGFLPRMALGVVLGYMYVWSGNLWLPIMGHFVNNAGAIVFYYLFQNGVSSIDPDKIGTESDFASVAISIVVTTFLLILLQRKTRKVVTVNEA